MLNTSVLFAIGAIACVVPTVYIVQCVQGLFHFWKRRKQVAKLPGMPALPIIGNLHQMPRPLDERFLQLMVSLTRQHPYCFYMKGLPYKATVFLCHPKTVKLILKTTEPKDVSRGGIYRYLLPWLGRGLLISDGQQWFRNRRLLTPAFHFDILKPYMAIYNQCADVLLDKWAGHTGGDASIDINMDVSLCTLNVIMRCAFSYEEDVQRLGYTHPYVKAVYRMAEIIASRPIRPWTHFEMIYHWMTEKTELRKLTNYVHHFADDVIDKRREEGKKSKDMPTKEKLDFLDILLSARDEDGRGLTDREIRQEVDTFMFEGHDTTASGISWILYELAKHPQYQEKAREEVDALLDGRTRPDIQWDDLSRLPYLTQCIKEGMRMHSPVPMVLRTLTKPMTVEGVELLPGTSVVAALHLIHHNPVVWGEDHMRYKPDRFLPDNISKMDSHAFCPFSAGPRNCIGQNFALYEEKVIIARLLHRYKLEVDDTYSPPQEIPKLVMRSHNGIHIRIKNRT